MRKLRRLPWRIPKPHHGNQAASQSDAAKHTAQRVSASNADAELERDLRRERERERMEMQPVAFAGGRYVYDKCAAPAVRGTEIRRKAARHRVMPFPVPA